MDRDFMINQASVSPRYQCRTRIEPINPEKSSACSIGIKEKTDSTGGHNIAMHT